MQAVKSINKAKAVTEEKINIDGSVFGTSIFTKAKKYITSIFFGDINSINVNSEKIRNYNNYVKAKNAEMANTIRIQTFVR